MKTVAKLSVGVVAIAAVIAVGVVGKCYVGGSCALKGHSGLSGDEKLKLAVDLVRVSQDGTSADLRGWLLGHAPSTVQEVVSGIDNTLDRAGRVRMNVLSTIYSLGSEGLSEDVVHQWAAVLRGEARGLLHVGPEQSDFIAKSYLMEGKRAEAAAEYSRFPEQASAQLFFQQNPELRAPASGHL